MQLAAAAVTPPAEHAARRPAGAADAAAADANVRHILAYLRADMVIESAFYKLPELLSSGSAGSDSFESTVVHFLSLALHMELNARNIPQPFDHTCPEKPYPIALEKARKPLADLYLSLSGVVPTTGPVAKAYGVRQDNWIEVKAYLGSTRHASTPPKTANAGRLVRDIIRLSLLPEESQGSCRHNGRYLVVVAAEDLSASLPFRGRPWLKELFSEGEASIAINIEGEQKSFQEAVGLGFIGLSPALIAIGTRTLTFRPDRTETRPLFWGYLIRIRDFRIILPSGDVRLSDEPDEHWGRRRVEEFETVRAQALGLMRER